MVATKPVDWERLLLFCLPMPAVRVTITCNKGKENTQAIDFNFIFSFPDMVLLPSQFFDLLFFPSSSGQFGCCGGSCRYGMLLRLVEEDEKESEERPWAC
jgi:hypothetical protein